MTISGNKQKIAGRKPQIIRCLGQMESYHLAVQLLGVTCNTIVACRYTIPEHLVGGECAPGLEAMFEKAVAQTVLEQPLLQVGIVGQNSKKPSWTQLASVDLRYHIEWVVVSGAKDLEAAYAAERRAQLDARSTHSDSRPGWRVMVWRKEGLPHLDAMFIWDHVSTDGTGSKIFHYSLLRNLNAPAKSLTGLRDHVLQTTVKADRFPPPQERVTSLPLSLGYTLCTAWDGLKPPIFASKNAAAQAAWAPIRALPYETQLRSIELSEATLQRVLSSCRKNKTTLTGLLHGIALVSLAGQLRMEEAPGFSAFTALDMRRFVSAASSGFPWLKADQTMGNFVSKMDHHFDAAAVAQIRGRLTENARDDGRPEESRLEDLVWASSATVRRDIEEELKKNGKNNIAGMMKFVGDWASFVKDEAKKPRTGSWLVTSLGVIDGQGRFGEQADGEKKEWSIDRAVFSVCADTNGPVFHISPVSAKGRGLWVDVSWQDGVVEAGTGQRLASDLESWLKYMGRPVQQSNT